MTEARLTAWRAEAARAAEALYTALDGMPPVELQDLVKIDPDRARGSNSLDSDFFQALKRGEHLTSSFLQRAS